MGIYLNVHSSDFPNFNWNLQSAHLTQFLLFITNKTTTTIITIIHHTHNLSATSLSNTSEILVIVINRKPYGYRQNIKSDHFFLYLPIIRAIIITIGISAILMAFMFLTSITYQCSNTFKWFLEKTSIFQNMCDEMTNSKSELKDIPTNSETAQNMAQGVISISHSLPDLQINADLLKHENIPEKDNNYIKKVLRQTTLPIVPTRLQTFKRQLSHRLDVEPDIKFSICTLEHRTDSSIGIIQPELYKKDLTRQASTESSSSDFVYCGKLYFSLKYDKDLEGLIVKIFEARDLPIKDAFGSSDPYVKIYLLPDRKKKYQTKVHRRNLNPIFNEVFIFSVEYNELRKRYLQFSVYDFDRFSKHDLIGHVFVRGLGDIADIQQEIEYTMNILCPPQENSNSGELMMSLCYLPKAGRLTLTIIKARNLKAMDITGRSDPYVKVHLLCQGKRIKKRKTSVKKSTLHPVYNEALLFDIPVENVYDVTLIVKVIDYDRIRPNELIGCTAIGSTAIGIGRERWIEMLENPRTPIAQWYPLSESLTHEQQQPQPQHNNQISTESITVKNIETKKQTPVRSSISKFMCLHSLSKRLSP